MLFQNKWNIIRDGWDQVYLELSETQIIKIVKFNQKKSHYLNEKYVLMYYYITADGNRL